MGTLVRAIPVGDANGDELILYEYRERVPWLTIFGLRFMRTVRRMTLCTGEPVDYVDEDNFLLVSSGEKLRRIERRSEGC